MKKIVMLIVSCLFLSLSLPSILSASESETQECTKVVTEIADFILKNVDKPLIHLGDEEKNKYYKLYKSLSKCEEKFLKANKVPYSRWHWFNLKILGVSKNPLDKVKPEKFAIIFFNDYKDYAAVLKKIYENSIDILVFWESSYGGPAINIGKLLKKLDKEKNKLFCYLRGAVISCPSFHLEKNFWPEIKKEYQEATSKKFSEPSNNEILYEVVRKLVPWMEKEFGPKGRGIIPSVLEKREVNLNQAETQ